MNEVKDPAIQAKWRGHGLDLVHLSGDCEITFAPLTNDNINGITVVVNETSGDGCL